MARPQILPSIGTLLQWQEEGLSQAKMAERVNEQNKLVMGYDYQPVTRSAVSVALFRAGESGDGRPRYEDEIPWSPIAVQWINDYRQLQLRTWGRLNEGEKVTPRARKEFESFKKRLEQYDAVIHYDDEGGFYPVKRRYGIDTGLIRLTPKQIHDRGLEEVLREYLENKAS